MAFLEKCPSCQTGPALRSIRVASYAFTAFQMYKSFTKPASGFSALERKNTDLDTRRYVTQRCSLCNFPVAWKYF